MPATPDPDVRRLARLSLALGLGLITLLSARAAEPRTEPAPAEDPVSPSRWAQRSARGKLDVTVAPRSGTPRIGVFQLWVVGLHDVQGNPVYPARIAIDGGMPAHGHGLPTQPKVTRYLGDGEYLIEGVRFNMAGDWVWRLRVETPDGPDDVKFNLFIDH